MQRAGLVVFLLVALVACDDPGVHAPPIGHLEAKDKLDFGDVQIGMTAKISLDVANTGTAALKVLEIQVDNGFAQKGFKLPVAPFALAPQDHKTLELEFHATEADITAESAFRFVTDIVKKEKQVVVTVTTRAHTIAPAILIEPNPVDFGPVLVGSAKEIDVAITNLLPIAVDLFATGDGGPFVVQQGGPGHFEIDMPTARSDGSRVLAEALQPNDTLHVTARYVPMDIADDVATAQIANCADPLCAVELTLTGSGTDAVLECDPSPLDFGNVKAGQSASRTTTCTNRAPEDVVVTGWALQSAPGYSVAAYAGTPSLLHPGDSFDVAVTFQPTNAQAQQTQPMKGALAIATRNNSTGASTDPALVPLSGVAVLDAQPLGLTCSANQTTPAGTAVTVTATATNVGGMLTSTLWTIVSGPAGGVGTPNQWTPDPPSQTSEQFLPYIVGSYVLRATVGDSLGRTATCDTTITAEGHGLRVELTWNGAGDVDLHVHNQKTTPWFTSDDCSYSDMAPIWDNTAPPMTGKNPGLDVDNTSANGPENVRVDVVALAQDYYVAVHNYDGAAGRTATIKIFCGAVTAPTATYSSHALVGNDAGDCTANEFWKVAKVRFTSQSTCTVTPINTYQTSSSACAGF